METEDRAIERGRRRKDEEREKKNKINGREEKGSGATWGQHRRGGYLEKSRQQQREAERRVWKSETKGHQGNGGKSKQGMDDRETEKTEGFTVDRHPDW